MKRKVKRFYSYVCIYTKEDCHSNEPLLLIAKKNNYAFWFDTTREEYEKGERMNRTKLGEFKVYPRVFDGHYFAFYPEKDGCPLENGPGGHCLIGGEVKPSNTVEPLEERLRVNSEEEFWEETGCRLGNLQIKSGTMRVNHEFSYGIYFVEVSRPTLFALADEINHNFNIVRTVDIPRVRNMNLSVLPTVWSNELELVTLLPLPGVLSLFESMDPQLTDWFVLGLVSDLILLICCVRECLLLDIIL